MYMPGLKVLRNYTTGNLQEKTGSSQSKSIHLGQRRDVKVGQASQTHRP